jgi:peptidoglycan/LPS O-acetylase OafA/YrhL
MPRINPNLRVSDHLDMIRGISALVVLVYHVRYRFFYGYSDLASPDLFAKIFYTATAFGHDAVMVFFVLSGYFISSSVLGDVSKNRWSWKRYAINRCTRLYVVLIPGLLLTICWDWLGLTLFPEHVVYSGAARNWQHDFVSISDRLNVFTFLANSAFLQTVIAPPLGSNESLWSLSYEFWYYVLFPAIWLAVSQSMRLWRRLGALCIVSLLLWNLGEPIRTYFLIWLLGTLVFFLPRIPSLSREWTPAAILASVSVYCGVLGVTHTSAFKSLVDGSIVAIDFTNAIAFAGLLYLLLHDQSTSKLGVYKSIAGKLAAFSYTLYVVHLPLLVFIRALAVPDAPWTPSVSHVLLAGLISVLAVFYAAIVYRFTEAKTDRVRLRLSGWLGVEVPQKATVLPRQVADVAR